MELTLWTYEGPPHVGAIRIAASMRDVHLVLHAPHPSPLSAHRGFLGCGHFSETNRYLESKGISPIDWSL